MATFNLNINGKQHRVDVAEDTPLLWVLRDHLGLVGTSSAAALQNAAPVPCIWMAKLSSRVCTRYPM